MNIVDLLDKASVGGFVSILVLITLLIQIAPIKLDPWSWVGDQLNKHMSQRVTEIEKNMSLIDGKLNAHIVESYRTNILDFADKVMSGNVYTKDKWSQMIKVCDLYEAYVRDNNLLNGDATEGIEYIREKYHELRQNNAFLTFPVQKDGTK